MFTNYANPLMGSSPYTKQSYQQPYGGYEERDPLSALLAAFGNKSDSYSGGLSDYAPNDYGQDPYAMCAPPRPKCAKQDKQGGDTELVKLLLTLILKLLSKDDNKSQKSYNQQKQTNNNYDNNKNYDSNNDYSSQYSDSSYDNNGDAVSSDYLDQLFGSTNPYADPNADTSTNTNVDNTTIDPFSSDSSSDFSG